MSRMDTKKKQWKSCCNKKQRHFNNQNTNDEDEVKTVRHYSETEYGELWNTHLCDYWEGNRSVYKNANRGKGHDKKKPWRD